MNNSGRKLRFARFSSLTCAMAQISPGQSPDFTLRGKISLAERRISRID
jgi:hypothetical protein